MIVLWDMHLCLVLDVEHVRNLHLFDVLKNKVMELRERPLILMESSIFSKQFLKNIIVQIL